MTEAEAKADIHKHFQEVPDDVAGWAAKHGEIRDAANDPLEQNVVYVPELDVGLTERDLQTLTVAHLDTLLDDLKR